MSDIYHYECVPGFFIHDNEDHRALTQPAVPLRMGLEDESVERWDKFREKIGAINEKLKAEGNGGEIKVFFFARHGQGYHNVAEAKYGTKVWDAEKSKMNGDGEMTWGPDPELTPIGINQAIEAKHGWEAELPFRIPLPDRLYCSPLTRAIQTCQISFEGIVLGNIKDKRRVMILENCREENGIHTCDKRRTRSYIQARFPNFEFEEGFNEEDELWDPGLRETRENVADRARRVLDYIFESDTSSTYVSVTAHGGIINGFLKAVGRGPFSLTTGGILPVVIKCRKG